MYSVGGFAPYQHLDAKAPNKRNNRKTVNKLTKWNHLRRQQALDATKSN